MATSSLRPNFNLVVARGPADCPSAYQRCAGLSVGIAEFEAHKLRVTGGASTGARHRRTALGMLIMFLATPLWLFSGLWASGFLSPVWQSSTLVTWGPTQTTLPQDEPDTFEMPLGLDANQTMALAVGMTVSVPFSRTNPLVARTKTKCHSGTGTALRRRTHSAAHHKLANLETCIHITTRYGPSRGRSERPILLTNKRRHHLAEPVSPDCQRQAPNLGCRGEVNYETTTW